MNLRSGLKPIRSRLSLRNPTPCWVRCSNFNQLLALVERFECWKWFYIPAFRLCVIGNRQQFDLTLVLAHCTIDWWDADSPFANWNILTKKDWHNPKLGCPESISHQTRGDPHHGRNCCTWESYTHLERKYLVGELWVHTRATRLGHLGAQRHKVASAEESII